MGEMKKYRLNCDVCDTRTMREDVFEGYDKIWINADVLLVSKESKKILQRYPVKLNVDSVVETEADVDVDIQTQNGAMEIRPDEPMERKIVLIVNGVLKIAPGSGEQLKRYLQIIVNGAVTYPKSLQPYLSHMTVNGKKEVYPDDCILLKATAVLDKYFALRAKENARYYAGKRVVLLDAALDADRLAEKKVCFVTPEVITAESMAESVVPLITDETELTVVPDGCHFVDNDVVLDEMLAKKRRLYINGSLELTEESTPFISELEYLYVNGEVRILEQQKQAFLELEAAYRSLKVCRGRIIAKKLKVYVDEAMLTDAAGSADGICLRKCVSVQLAPEVTAEQIRQKLEIDHCVEVHCAKEQRAAVEFVSHNVLHITIEGQEEEKAQEQEQSENVINADMYIL